MLDALSSQSKSLNVDGSLNLRFQESAYQNDLDNYYLASNSSSYLIVTDLNNGGSNNYILQSNLSEISIDLSIYTSGNYVVTLVSDGNIIESKNLIKS
ncbi:hypothetical protein P700755_001267 [Psychroflexus torquis ATCC 700755]|uniref:Secretion system C-terminal sorting domain-containing protein n=1 Tax=Psychroflexus torquis (strain ATCC 700755 / CIP 106069 / ACAM 623) TaxID=313595 RepID=K4IC61_PSYTT|nr:hypothetical protein [Psychroflexus torquis]AFU68202.1 hypothetical protein P700755_001267 [Psychroflexus torquis ATCC 700755]